VRPLVVINLTPLVKPGLHLGKIAKHRPGQHLGLQKKEYLVYVASGPSNIETGICSGTKSIVGAEPEMEQLDQLARRSSQVKP
jgi:hypothetical protein